jgi:hypothetical protein
MTGNDGNEQDDADGETQVGGSRSKNTSQLVHWRCIYGLPVLLVEMRFHCFILFSLYVLFGFGSSESGSMLSYNIPMSIDSEFTILNPRPLLIVISGPPGWAKTACCPGKIAFRKDKVHCR